jgi:NitT/TauT family transport system substrate-binding protein
MLRKGFLTLVLVILSAIGVQAQDAPRDLTFFLTYIPNIQFAPVYVALEKGYFADAGLNVTLQSGDEPDGINLIAANELQFGFASGEQVIAARAQERPVRFVYEWFQKYPVGVLVTDTSGVTAPADLAGQKIGIPGLFGASYTGVIALLAANDLTEQDVQLEPIGFNAPQVVCVGGVQAAVVYTNNEPLQIQDRIDADDCGGVTGITVFPVADVADMVSNGIITNEETIASEPELVAAFVAAYDQALRDTINNPAEAYLLSASYVDGLPLPDDLKTVLESEAATAEALSTTEERTDYRTSLLDALRSETDGTALLQVEVLLSSIALWDADQLGYSDEASWQVTQDTLIAMGLLDVPIDLSAAYTNEFLPSSE